MRACPPTPRSLRASLLLLSLLGCGGGGGGGTAGGPSAAIVVPSAVAAHVVPGGALSFEGSCGAAAVAHAWSFEGGAPSSSTENPPAPVTFAAAGTYRVTYRCTDAEGTESATAARTVTVAPEGPTDFAVDLPAPLSGPDHAEDFAWAAARLVELVRGPVPGLELSEPASADCGDVPIHTSVGTLLVLTTITPIDGLGGIQASSGPCYVRTSDGLPIAGLVRIDSADVATLQADGALRAVILHEMLHVLGFGALWGPEREHGFGLLAGTEADPYFTGPQARAAFRDFDGGAAYAGPHVPVEAGSLAGTRGAHWRRSVFGPDELMVASVSPDARVSRTTLEALADLGYRVDLSQADDFAIPLEAVLGQAAARGSGSAAPASVDLSGDALPVVPRIRGP